MLSDFAVKLLVQSSWSEICNTEIFLSRREKSASEIDSSEGSQKSHQRPVLARTAERLTCCEVERNSVVAESCAG